MWNSSVAYGLASPLVPDFAPILDCDKSYGLVRSRRSPLEDERPQSRAGQRHLGPGAGRPGQKPALAAVGGHQVRYLDGSAASASTPGKRVLLAGGACRRCVTVTGIWLLNTEPPPGLDATAKKRKQSAVTRANSTLSKAVQLGTATQSSQWRDAGAEQRELMSASMLCHRAWSKTPEGVGEDSGAWSY